MRFLKSNFLLFSYSGVWMTDSIKNSKWKSMAYNLYTLTLLVLGIMLIAERTVLIFLLTDINMKKLAYATIGHFEMFCSMLKGITVYMKHDEMLEIGKSFSECISKNIQEEEIEIQVKTDKTCK